MHAGPARPRLLWLDDDDSFLDSIENALAEDFVITTATSVSDAIARLQQDQYDAVVTDLVMQGAESGTAGIDFVRSVREKAPALPIVVVSGFPTHYARELHLLGIDALIPKSQLEIAAFREAMTTVLAKGSQHTTTDYVRYHDLRRTIEDIVTRLIPEKERTLDLAVDGRFSLPKPLVGFKPDIERQLRRFPFARNVFLMMKFRSTNADLGAFIIDTLAAHGLRGIRADAPDWNITHNVYNPIAVLYCCKFGIALFDEAETGQAYSANVAYELGIMHNQEKDCLILRHTSLPTVPFDLIKDLYQVYERDLQVRGHIERWARQVSQ
jgi:DNA-binding NarL/FixJ family response regulator